VSNWIVPSTSQKTDCNIAFIFITSINHNGGDTLTRGTKNNSFKLQVCSLQGMHILVSHAYTVLCNDPVEWQSTWDCYGYWFNKINQIEVKCQPPHETLILNVIKDNTWGKYHALNLKNYKVGNIILVCLTQQVQHLCCSNEGQWSNLFFVLLWR